MPIESAQMSAQSAATLKVVKEYHQAWKLRDIGKIMSMFHGDIEYHDFFSKQSMGMKTLPEYLQSCMPRDSTRFLAHTDRIRVDGDTAFIQYNLLMQGATYRSSEAITVKDGLISQINEYGVLISDNNEVSDANMSDRSAISRLGLSARALANLSEDLNEYFSKNKPFLNPELTLQQVANDSGYSRNQISYFLNKVAGLTFYEYVHEARIEYCLSQMKASASLPNINTLALDAGFNSLSVFYKHFRRITGYSPKAYLIKKGSQTEK